MGNSSIENAKVRITADGMEAYLSLPPLAPGESYTLSQLLACIQSQKVSSGIDEVALQSMIDTPIYGHEVCIARGRKPGNLGAVLRSADASGADAVIVCDPLTDIWNPNLIRNSTGAIFSVPCVACSSQECIDFLKARGVRILTAQLQDSELYYDTDMRPATAIVMGTEATGLTEIWRKAADAHIRIPMLGLLDSLNVSVSAAILLYEAVRQRNG